jgi:hypothetical protein
MVFFEKNSSRRRKIEPEEEEHKAGFSFRF